MLKLLFYRYLTDSFSYSLRLVKTNSDFVINTVEEIDSISGWFQDNIPPDTVHILDILSGDRINVIYGMTHRWYEDLLKVSFKQIDFDSLSIVLHENDYYGLERIHDIVKSPCSFYRIKSAGQTPIGGFSGRRWKSVWWVNMNNGQVVDRLDESDNSFDVWGPTKSLTHNHHYLMNSPIYLSVSTSFNDLFPPYNQMQYRRSDLDSEPFYLDFFPFLAVHRTNTDDVMIFGKTDDTLWVHYPMTCLDGYYFEGSTSTTGQVCPGNYFNDVQVFSDTIIYDTLFSATCPDTLLQYIVNTYPSYDIQDNTTICMGETVIFLGDTLSHTGTYSQTLLSANGCDSTIALNLQVVPPDSTQLTFNLCEGDPSPLTGDTYPTAGDFTEQLFYENIHGCDSLVNATLTVHANEAITTDTQVPYGTLYNDILLTQDTQFIYHDTTAFGCLLTITENIMVGPNATNELEGLLALSISPNPVGNGQLSINMQLVEKMKLDIQITDVLGRQVADLEQGRGFSAGRTVLQYNTADWPDGQLFLVVKNADGRAVFRLVKQGR